MRPGEVRATNLDDYESGRVNVSQAVQGPRLNAPVRHTKNRSAGWREAWDEELREWIEWRGQQTPSEKRLRGTETALFWNPTARNPEKRWTPDPMRKEWLRACEKVGVRIPLYQGTKHSTATALAEGGLSTLVLKALGGWKDAKSAERCAKPEAHRAALVRALNRPTSGPRDFSGSESALETNEIWRGGRDSKAQLPAVSARKRKRREP